MLVLSTRNTGLCPVWFYLDPTEDDSGPQDSLTTLLHSAGIRYDVDFAYGFFGLSVDSGRRRYEILGKKPEVGFQDDLSKRLAFINNLVSLFTDWKFTSGVARHTKEKSVHHRNLRGYLRVGGARESYLDPHYPGFINAPTYFLPHGPVSEPADVSLAMGSYQTVPRSGYFDTWPLGLPWLQGYVRGGGLDVVADGGVRYKEFLYNLTPNGFDIYYPRQLITKSGSSWLHRLYFIRMGFRFGFPETVDLSEGLALSSALPYDLWIELNFFSQVTNSSISYDHFAVKSASFYAKDWTGVKGSVSPNIGQRSVYVVPERLMADQPVFDLIGHDRTSFSDSKSLTFNHFHSVIHGYNVDMLATAFRSSQSAVDEYISEVKGNLLENLTELSSLFGLVDVASLAAKVISLRRSAARGNFLKHALDILTDAKLLFSFAVAPGISDARDISQKASSLRDVFFGGSIFKLRTVRGTYTTEFSAPPYEDVGLVTRSKLRIRLHPDSLLPYIVPVKSLGLLPTLSTVWDLIPFSFVIDWFANVGESLEAVEDSGFFALFEVDTSLHSCKATYRFDDIFLKEQGISGLSSAGSLEYVLYERILLDALPKVTPSRILADEYVPSFPNWGTVGSLLYKWIT